MGTKMEIKTGIIWLASYPKSGNTWTRAFLHNLLYLIYEGTDKAVDINEMHEFSTWELAAKRYAELAGKDPEELTHEDVAALRGKVQEMIADEVNGLSFVKTHNALVMDRGYPVINMAVTSGAIYIVRNPLDVAISFAHHMGRDIDHAIEFMETEGMETELNRKAVHEIYGSWSQHVASWTAKPHRAIYVMRYEDMLADPFGTFGKLARHILLNPTDEQLRKAIDNASFQKLKQQEEKNAFREKPKVAKRFFRSGKAGEWKEVLTDRQIRRIVSAHKEQMERFGYYPL